MKHIIAVIIIAAGWIVTAYINNKPETVVHRVYLPKGTTIWDVTHKEDGCVAVSVDPTVRTDRAQSGSVVQTTSCEQRIWLRTSWVNSGYLETIYFVKLESGVIIPVQADQTMPLD